MKPKCEIKPEYSSLKSIMYIVCVEVAKTAHKSIKKIRTLDTRKATSFSYK